MERYHSMTLRSKILIRPFEPYPVSVNRESPSTLLRPQAKGPAAAEIMAWVLSLMSLEFID